MKTKKAFLILFNIFLLVFFVSIVNAQEDFTASTQPNVELCPCSNQAYSVIMQNTGAVQSSYSVVAAGEAADWVSFNPSEFVLTPGQSGAFNVVVNSVCNVKGDFELEIFISTSSGLAKLIKQTLTINECYDYSLGQGKQAVAEDTIDYVENDENYALCTDERKSIPILITNNEDFGNEYKLILDAPEWARLNLDNVKLGAKQSGIVLINYDTANILGDFDFKLNAVSSPGKVQRKSALHVNVGKCYDLELGFKEREQVCGGELTEQVIVVKNKGTISQKIDLDLDAPEWADFEEVTLPFTLAPDAEKEIALNLNPEDAASGNFDVKITAVPDNKTQFAVSETLDADVSDKLACYQADISSKSSVSNLYKEDFFFVKVTNNGVKKASYAVSLEGPSWASLNPGSLELNPGQTGNINVNVNPPSDIEPNTYGIKINLESNDAFYSKNFDIKLRKETEFEKQAKATIKSYQYYLYLIATIAILFVIFFKPIMRKRDKIKEKHRKYKIRQERLKALRLARQKKAEEKRKQERKERKKKTKQFWKKNKIWVSVVAILGVLILAGHFLGFYNLKYTDIYIKNIIVGYFYYILIGIGIVLVLFLAILFYNYLRKRPRKPKKKKIKKEVKKEIKKETRRETKRADKQIRKAKDDGWYNKPSHVLAVFVPIIVIITALAYFNLFDDIASFVVLYSYYFILGIILLVIIILALTFYKPFTKFLKE